MLPITVCIIAKNEEKYIAECLSRLSLYDWEIIVVDTGSTDQTVEIAKSYTANVYHFDWINDFSTARNYSISLAQNDWILIVDCDEYLECDATTYDFLSKLPNKLLPSQIGMIDRFSITAETSDTSTNAVPELVHESIARFFHKKHVHYQGSIHEQLTPTNNEALEFVSLPLSFQHVGYSTMTLKSEKAMRNIAMLEEELAYDSSNPYLLFQLGQSYFGLNDYKQALPYFEKALSVEVNEQEDYVQTLVESYGYCLLYLQQYEKALELDGIYLYFSKHADFVFLMGLIYMNNALFDRAIAEFLKATTIHSYSVDGVNSYKAFYNIGIIHECMGNIEQAITYYKQCGNYSPALIRISQHADTQ